MLNLSHLKKINLPLTDPFFDFSHTRAIFFAHPGDSDVDGHVHTSHEIPTFSMQNVDLIQVNVL